jgi:dihydropteroate synthase
MGAADKPSPPLVMGIVNVTPDSFSDGGQFANAQQAIDHGLCLIKEGADLLDIGGQSTRPGAGPVSLQEELDRVMPVIEKLAQQTSTPLSIDTMKPEVAQAAMGAGASLWNDVSALRASSASMQTAADLKVPIVLMHMLGEPGTMQEKPHYNDAVSEVIVFLNERASAAIKAGVREEHILVDPGIGFGKRLQDNLALMVALPRIICETGYPLLFGASRKSFIEKLDPDAPGDQRLGGSLASALVATKAGAYTLRVHDVQATVQALKVWYAIEQMP